MEESVPTLRKVTANPWVVAGICAGVLIGLMAALCLVVYILLPKGPFSQDAVKGFATVRSIGEIEAAVNAFHDDCGRFPTTAEGLDALQLAPAYAKGWNGPYLKSGVPRDGWDQPFHYEAEPAVHNVGKFDVWSDGIRGEPGTGVGNWKK